eukprot:gene6193-12546_t
MIKDRTKSLSEFAKQRELRSSSSQVFVRPRSMPLDEVRAQLIGMGLRGFVSLARNFRELDTDSSKTVTWPKFKQAIRDVELVTNEAILAEIFRSFESKRSGFMNYDDFLATLRGKFPIHRKELVYKIFENLKRDNSSDLIDPEDVVDCFDASRHPDAENGQRSPNDIRAEFLETFDIGSEVEGKVTRSEFEIYYANLSACMPNDDQFEAVLRGVWGIQSIPRSFQAPANPPNHPPNNPKNSNILESDTNRLIPSNSLINIPSLGVQMTMRSLQKELKYRGVIGYVELQRALREIEERGGTGLVSLLDLKHCLRQYGLGTTLPDADIRMLYDHLDTSGKGGITQPDLLSHLRPALSGIRLRLVSSVFSVLDRDGDDMLLPREVVQTYTAACHPDVISGLRSVEEVYGEFLETFDVGGEVEGKVTRS